MRISPARLLSAVLSIIASGCGGVGGGAASRPSAVAALEEAYRELRAYHDQVDIARNRGEQRGVRGIAMRELEVGYDRARGDAIKRLASPSLDPGSAEDRRAVDVIRKALETTLVERATAGGDTSGEASPDCDYDPAALVAAPNAALALGARIYACYGRAVLDVRFDGEVLDRLTVLGMLPRTDDPERRRRLFLALGAVWQTVNGDNGARSPYRHLVRLRAPEWTAARSPVDASVRALGSDPAEMERWLVSILERWRTVTPNALVEPWDWYYAAGRASRALSPRLPLSRLRSVNDEYFASLGASPDSLGIQYDLVPRAGKTPVAFTTFGTRARPVNGRWIGGEAWVFATYRVGGLDNLNELLHETGHGVHIAAIRTRPAFLDWPDSDPFTEALGDFPALDAYEPAWQMRWLGDSVPLRDALRAKYAGIVLDIAWALFDARMHRNPSLDPNRLWTDITSEYLRIAPHPELSWWAMRGQLVNAPGYMMNYAIGAIIAADLRARARALRGSWLTGDRGWYAWMSDRLYRFGLERPSRVVVEQFLGRRMSPDALLEDLGRMGSSSSGRR